MPCEVTSPALLLTAWQLSCSSAGARSPLTHRAPPDPHQPGKGFGGETTPPSPARNWHRRADLLQKLPAVLPPPTGSTCSWKDFLGWLHPAITTAHPDEGGSCSSAAWGSHRCFWGCLGAEQKCSSPRVMLVLQLGEAALVLWAGSDAKSSKTLRPSVRRAGLTLFI